jgi:hypothetical protein
MALGKHRWRVTINDSWVGFAYVERATEALEIAAREFRFAVPDTDIVRIEAKREEA